MEYCTNKLVEKIIMIFILLVILIIRSELVLAQNFTDYQVNDINGHCYLGNIDVDSSGNFVIVWQQSLAILTSSTP